MGKPAQVFHLHKTPPVRRRPDHSLSARNFDRMTVEDLLAIVGLPLRQNLSMKRRVKKAIFRTAFLWFIMGTVGLAAWAQETVTIDLSVDNGPATYRASGFLHGMDSTAPDGKIVNPVKGKLFRSGGDYDDPNTYARVVALGATPEFILSDGWSGINGCYDNKGTCPGDAGKWTAWDSYVTTKVGNYFRAGKAFQYDIWNEPDTSVFWPRSESQYHKMWQHAVNDIRAISPNIKIVGPTTCCENGGAGWGAWAKHLLAFAKTNNVLPDIVSFHENDTVALLVRDIAAAKAYLAAHDPGITGIEVNEMVGQADDYLPGATVQYLAAVERAQISAAAHTCWRQDCGNVKILSGLVAPDGVTIRAIWYAYQAYANITGTIVGVTPSVTVDGVAGQDSTSHQAYAVFGRSHASGDKPKPKGKEKQPSPSVTFTFNNISSASYLEAGDRVHAKVYTLSNDNGKGSPGPTLLSESNITVLGNSISISISTMGINDVAIIQLTPGYTR